MIKFLIAVWACSAGAAVSFPVGEKVLEYTDQARQRKVATYVWYPAALTSKPQVVEGGIFADAKIVPDATPAETKTKWPTVLLSHGSGGKADKLFWLAGALAEQGIAVVAVDHPGNRLGDNSAEGLLKVWDRALDLTFVLDQTLAHPLFKNRLDITRVAAVGHSAGGATALLLGGARFTATEFTSPIPHCDGAPDPYLTKFCQDLKAIDPKRYGKKIIEGDYHDPRVKAVVALDPGFARSFSKASLRGLGHHALVLLADKLDTPDDEIYAKDFLKLPVSAHIVPKTYHFTFLQACKPGLPKSDPELKILCVENESRPARQKEIIDETLSFLRKNWEDGK